MKLVWQNNKTVALLSYLGSKHDGVPILLNKIEFTYPIHQVLDVWRTEALTTDIRAYNKIYRINVMIYVSYSSSKFYKYFNLMIKL